MRILHIANKPVYPKIDGGCVAMASLLDSLSRIGSVDHICISTPKHKLNKPDYPGNIILPFDEEDVFTDTSVSFTGALYSLLRGKNYNLSRFYSTKVEELIQRLYNENKYDLIVLDSAFLLPYLKICKSSGALVALRTHNVESDLWFQKSKSGNFLKRKYLLSLAKSLKREELNGLNKADLIWTITDADRKKFIAQGITAPISTIPVGIEIPAEKCDYTSGDFFHIGSMNWEPNREAVDFLVNFWERNNISSQLHIAGSFSETAFKSSENIKVHGFVNDAGAFMVGHGILLTPLFTGSGIRIKLLEAMALGIPCVTTNPGAAGINDAEHSLRICNSEEEWLESVKQLGSSIENRRALGERGIAYIRKYHSFAAVESAIRESLGR